MKSLPVILEPLLPLLTPWTIRLFPTSGGRRTWTGHTRPNEDINTYSFLISLECWHCYSSRLLRQSFLKFKFDSTFWSLGNVWNLEIFRWNWLNCFRRKFRQMLNNYKPSSDPCTQMSLQNMILWLFDNDKIQTRKNNKAHVNSTSLEAIN